MIQGRERKGKKAKKKGVKFVKKKIRKKGIISNLPLQNIRE
jgi:glycerol-3-phosphate responsive antiterminator